MAERDHSPLRIAVGLALTGCAFIAGRRTQRDRNLWPPPVESSVGERFPEISPPVRVDAATGRVAPTPNLDDRTDPVAATTPSVASEPPAATLPESPVDPQPEPPVTESSETAPAAPELTVDKAPETAPAAPEPTVAAVESPCAGPTRRESSRPSDHAVAFDAVMTRVTNLIDAAASVSLRQADMPSSASAERLASAPSATAHTHGTPDPGAGRPAEAPAEEQSDASSGPNDVVSEKIVSEEEVVTEDVGSADDLTDDDVTDEIASMTARYLTGNIPTSGGLHGEALPRRAKPRIALSNEGAVTALRRTGIGEDMVRPVSEGLRRGGDLEALLLEAFGRFAAAPSPPRLAGSLLVVVGAGRQAQRLATTLADEIGADPHEVAFATLDPRSPAVIGAGRRLQTAVEAAERAPGWRRSQPAVVAVEAPMTCAVRSWAGRLIASLRPTAVWGVVDSTCKIEDIASWASGLGGLDALAVDNVAATVSPGTALAVGIPVARLDGRSATAQCWAATIVDAVNSIDPTDLAQPGRGHP